MTTLKTCRAIKKNGEPCSNSPRTAGLCGRHYPKPSRKVAKNLLEGVKTAGQIIAVAGGAVTLVENIIKLWTGLSFGPSPSMPEDFRYLWKKAGPFLPDPPKHYQAFNKSADCIDWQKARSIYDASVAEFQAGDSTSPLDDDRRAEEIEAMVSALIDTMHPVLQERLLRDLGAVEGGESY
jgi:hypothetical protein